MSLDQKKSVKGYCFIWQVCTGHQGASRWTASKGGANFYYYLIKYLLRFDIITSNDSKGAANWFTLICITIELNLY